MLTHERQARIHRYIELGDLPDRVTCVRLWGGAGSLRPCQVCGELIAASAVEYELDLDERTIVLCLPCFRLWRAEPSDA
jgi:hypothetical protein